MNLPPRAREELVEVGDRRLDLHEGMARAVPDPVSGVVTLHLEVEVLEPGVEGPEDSVLLEPELGVIVVLVERRRGLYRPRRP